MMKACLQVAGTFTIQRCLLEGMSITPHMLKRARFLHVGTIYADPTLMAGGSGS
jgi:hypothetical protein